MIPARMVRDGWGGGRAEFSFDTSIHSLAARPDVSIVPTRIGDQVEVAVRVIGNFGV